MLLDRCALVVQEQQEALSAQADLIEVQDQILEHKTEQIESEQRAKERATGIAIVEGLLLLLLIL